jgi:hypothetical protein
MRILFFRQCRKWPIIVPVRIKSVPVHRSVKTSNAVMVHRGFAPALLWCAYHFYSLSHINIGLLLKDSVSDHTHYFLYDGAPLDIGQFCLSEDERAAQAAELAKRPDRLTGVYAN